MKRKWGWDRLGEDSLLARRSSQPNDRLSLGDTWLYILCLPNQS